MVENKGLSEELLGVLSHEARRLLLLVSRGSSSFISDDELASKLAASLYATPTSMNRAIKDYTSVALRNFMEVI